MRATKLPTSESTTIPPPVSSSSSCDAVIVGGGPAGLLSAIMYAQKFPHLDKIHVYERLPLPPPDPMDDEIWNNDVAKFYLIGLSSRGQKALKHFKVWNDVKRVCTAVVGRKDWSPESAVEEGVERIFTDRPYTTQVLPREKLVGVLYDYIETHYSNRVVMHYGLDVEPLDFGSEEEFSVKVRISSNQKGGDNSYVLSTNLLIAADGASRTVAAKMESMDEQKWNTQTNNLQKLFIHAFQNTKRPFKIHKYIDDNQRVYKTIPMTLPSEWRTDLNYSARTKGSLFNFDALPADANGKYCAVLLMVKEDELAQANTEHASKLRDMFTEFMPQFGNVLDDDVLAQVATKGPSYLPSFRYATPRLHQSDRTVLLGDCAHTLKPYFGLGANSALEDVLIFGNALDAHPSNMGDAVRSYSKKRAGEAKALVKISRGLDRPGKLGFFTFILPLILDSIFHKACPVLFAPNTISMLQVEGITFKGIQRRKRMDRIGQLSIIGGIIGGFLYGVKSCINLLGKVMGKRNTTVMAGIMMGMAGTLFLRKFAFFFLPNLAPADVLAKTNSKITSDETSNL